LARTQGDCALLDYCHYLGASQFKHLEAAVGIMAASRHTDGILLTVTLMLLAIGLAMVYSTSAVLAQERYGDSLYFLKRQLLWAGLGLLAMWGGRCVPYRIQQRLTMPGVFCTLAALVLVLSSSFGKEVGGARRWLQLGALTIQPSEMAKYVLILYVARTLGQSQDRMASFTHGYLPNVLIMVLFAALTFAQPDLGTAVVLTATAGLQLMIAGVPLRYLSYTALAGLPILYWGLVHVRFRLARLLVFLDPWADPQGSGYQTIQALLALGKGGMFGIGLGQSQQKLFYLPEAHTDFIFAVIGEELGFLGAVGLIMLFLILLWRILRIALACDEPFGIYLGLGVFGLLAIQIMMNLGVVVGLLPTKGLPLPLISLGGSNLLVSLMAIGTMLNMAESRFP
jgi:cell division protein FtsW